MTDYSGVNWRVNYGEIAEREQFRVGFVGQTSFEAYFEVTALAELITLLNDVQSFPLGQIAKGSTLQLVKVDAGYNTVIVIEPLSGTNPEQIMRLDLTTAPDLVYALQLFQTNLPEEPVPDDWDFSEQLPIVVLDRDGFIKEENIPTRLSAPVLDARFLAATVSADAAQATADTALSTATAAGAAAAAAQTTANGRATVASVTAAQAAADAAQTTANGRATVASVTTAQNAADAAQTTANSAAAAAAALPTTDLTNRIPNSKLGDVVSGLPALWSRSGNPVAINAVTIPEIPGTVWKLDGVSSQIGVLSSWFDVTPNEVMTYLLTYRGSLTGTTSAPARIEWRNTAGTSAGTFSQNLTLPGAANASTTFIVTVPSDAVQARIFILHASSATAGSWYVRASLTKRVVGSEVLGPLQFPGLAAVTGMTKVVTSDDATGLDGNLYNSMYRTPSGVGFALGSRATPVPDARPVLWAQKYSSANRATVPTEWDQGGGYFGLEKRSGDAYGAALTGFGRHESTDGGDLIGVHGRASAYKGNSRVWGMWAYAHAADPALVPVSIIGIEINLNSRVPDQGYTPATGYSKGLLVVTQDSSLPVSMGVEVGRGTAAPDGHFHIGYKVRRDSILPSLANSSTVITDNEAFLIEGATSVGNAANGIRFGYGHMRTGITFSEATIANNAALVFGEGHRIVVGPGASVTSYAEFSRSGSFLNLSNLFLYVNGTKVVGARKTGWGAPTGTSSRAAFDTASVTLPQLAQVMKALLEDLGSTSHGLIGA